MSRKAKHGSSVGRFLRQALGALLAGALFLAAAGAIVAVAVSVSQRDQSPEDVVRHYQGYYEPQWYNSPQYAPKISDVEIIRRHTVAELNAVHLSFNWKLDMHGQRSTCRGDVLAQAYPDVFGGWRELGHIGMSCGGNYVGSSVKYTYWESPAWEIPHTYNFYAYGSHARATGVAAVLADGSRERVDLVDGEYVLLVRRDAPFRVKWVEFIGADGEVFTHRHIE